MSVSIKMSAVALSLIAGAAVAEPYLYVGLNYEARVAVIDLATNTVVGYVPTHANTSSISFEPGTNYAYAVGGGTVTKIDTATNSEGLWVSFGTSIGQGVMHPDGGKLFIGFGTDACVRGFDTATLTQINTGSMPNNTVYLSITNDGNYIYAASANFLSGPKRVSVMDTSTYAVSTPITMSGMAGAVQLTPDNTRLYVGYEFDSSFNNGNKIEVYDTATDTLAATISVPAGGVTDVVFTTNGSKAYAFQPYLGLVTLIDVASSSVVTSWSVGGMPWGGSLSADGQTLYVADFMGDLIRLVRTSDGATITTIPVGLASGGPVCAEVAPALINTCAADFDGTGFVDTDDFDAFVNAFESGDESADFDGTGFVDTDDFDAFVRAFEAGC